MARFSHVVAAAAVAACAMSATAHAQTTTVAPMVCRGALGGSPLHPSSRGGAGLSILGFGLGALAGAGLSGGGESAGLGILLIGVGGAAAGLLTSNIVNAALLSDNDQPRPGASLTPRRMRFTIAPQVDLSPGRAQLRGLSLAPAPEAGRDVPPHGERRLPPGER